MTPSLWVHILISLVSGRHIFLGVIHPLWLLLYFCLHFCIAYLYSPEEWGLIKISHLRLSIPKPLSQHIAHLRASMLVHLLHKEFSLMMVKQGIDRWVYQNSTKKVIVLLCPFSRIIAFGVLLAQSQILGHFSTVRHEFHLMVWVLNPIREWLFTPQCSCHYCTSIPCRQVIIVDGRICSYSSGYHHLYTHDSLSTMNVSHGWRHKCIFSMFREMYMLFAEIGPYHRFVKRWRADNSLGHSLSCSGSLPSTQLDETISDTRSFTWWWKISSWGVVSSIILSLHLDFFNIWSFNILKTSSVGGFNMIPQRTFSINCFSPYFLS